MNRYIVPKMFCALGTLVIFAGIFLSNVNISLGNMPTSAIIALIITTVLLLLAITTFQMKTAHKKRCLKKMLKCKTVEIFSVIIFAISGIASLLIFNHCFAVWQSTDEIKKNMNIHQLENLLPKYENYANQRIKEYTIQLDEAIRYKQYGKTELENLGFSPNSLEDLNSQRNGKIKKLEQVVYPHIYDSLKISITDSINTFIRIVEGFSPLTMPKNITRIEEWAKSWEAQLINFSYHKMKGENATDFHFESTFGNVDNILTTYDDYLSEKRFLGYGIGVFALIFMLFPYFFGIRSIKITKSKM